MAGRLPTLLQSHLTELRRQYLEASQRGAVALKAHDIREFESAMSQKQTIHDEWMSVLENYFENHVRLRPRGSAASRTPAPRARR